MLDHVTEWMIVKMNDHVCAWEMNVRDIWEADVQGMQHVYMVVRLLTVHTFLHVMEKVLTFKRAAFPVLRCLRLFFICSSWLNLAWYMSSSKLPVDTMWHCYLSAGRVETHTIT